jgi:hypothetical protein
VPLSFSLIKISIKPHQAALFFLVAYNCYQSYSNTIDMKNHLAALAALILLSLATVQAQSPAPEPDTLRDPVKQIDPTVTELPPSVDYTQNMIKITSVELPKAVHNTLDSPEYKGWEKASTYRSRTGKIYLLEMHEGDQTKIYRFNAEGQLLKNEK